MVSSGIVQEYDGSYESDGSILALSVRRKQMKERVFFMG